MVFAVAPLMEVNPFPSPYRMDEEGVGAFIQQIKWTLA